MVATFYAEWASPERALSAFTFPGEGSYYLLVGVDRAGLFGGTPTRDKRLFQARRCRAVARLAKERIPVFG